jgi:hypothetical protein
MSFIENINNINDAILQGLSNAEKEALLQSESVSRKQYGVPESLEIKELKVLIRKTKSKIKLYELRIRDVMFPSRTNSAKRRCFIETMLNLECILRDGDVEEPSVNTKTTSSTLSNKKKSKYVGNLDELYLAWSVDYHCKWTNGVVDKDFLRMVLKSCWFNDYDKIAVYKFKMGETISECHEYLINDEGIPVTRFIPHRAFMPKDDHSVYVVGDMTSKPLMLNLDSPEDRAKYETYCYNLLRDKEMRKLKLNPINPEDVLKYEEIISTGVIYEKDNDDSFPQFEYENGLAVFPEDENDMESYIKHSCTNMFNKSSFFEEHIGITNTDSDMEIESTTGLSSLTDTILGERNTRLVSHHKDSSMLPTSSSKYSIITEKCEQLLKQNDNMSPDQISNIVVDVLDSISDYVIPVSYDVISESTGKSVRNRMRNAYDLGQDLYETPPWVVHCLGKYLSPIIRNNKPIVLLDPCSGPSNLITNILNIYFEESNTGYRSISTDLFYGQKINFLHDEIQDYDAVNLIVTNPPWGLKIDFVTKCYCDNKSFVLLLPLTTLTLVSLQDYFIQYGVTVLVLSPVPKFEHNGENIYTGGCAWFLYIVGMPNKIKVKILKKDDSI